MNSLGLRPNGVSDLAPSWFLSSISFIIGRPGTPDPLNPCVDVRRATLGCSKDRFFKILIDLGPIKKQGFLASHQKVKNQRISRSWRPLSPFWIKKHDFWHPIGHQLFDFFKNLQKRRFHCKTNTLGMYSASTNCHFRSKFVWFFMFFKTARAGSRCWSLLKSWICVQFRFSGLSKRYLLDTVFGLKGFKGEVLLVTGSVLAATLLFTKL